MIRLIRYLTFFRELLFCFVFKELYSGWYNGLYVCIVPTKNNKIWIITKIITQWFLSKKDCEGVFFFCATNFLILVILFIMNGQLVIKFRIVKCDCKNTMKQYTKKLKGVSSDLTLLSKLPCRVFLKNACKIKSTVSIVKVQQTHVRGYTSASILVL